MENIDKGCIVSVAKWANYLAVLLIIADVVDRCFSFGSETDPFFFLLTFYLVGFAVLLVIAEANVRRVLIYIEFLNGRVGKGIYLILVGLLMFDVTSTCDEIIGILIFMIGVFNILVGCMKVKKSDKKDESDASSQDLDQERH